MRSGTGGGQSYRQPRTRIIFERSNVNFMFHPKLVLQFSYTIIMPSMIDNQTRRQAGQ